MLIQVKGFCPEGNCGTCREAAIHNSPGLQPWVTRRAKFALKAPPARCAGAIRRRRNTPILQYSNTPPARNRGRGRGRERSASRVAAEGASLGCSSVIPASVSNIGCHFQGTFHQPPDPGLKLWAVLYSRSAAKFHTSLRDKNPWAPVCIFDSTSKANLEDEDEDETSGDLCYHQLQPKVRKLCAIDSRD